jgi:FkbM family methyltransferase
MPHLRKTICWWSTRLLEKSLSLLDPGDIEAAAHDYARSLNFDEERPIAKFAHQLSEMVSNIPNSHQINGERWLLERTGRFNFRTMLDVGANVGVWTRSALTNHPHAVVHCFEIVESTFQLLQSNLTPYADRVVVNPMGLLDHAGIVDVYLGDSDLLSSVYQAGHGQNKITCRVVRGDDYVKTAGLSQLDIVKIDVEGAEGKVLAGLTDTLAAGKVKLLQFEYNRGAVLGGFLLRDAYALLRPHGYILGKLTPNGVLFRDFKVEHENFNGPNYVACHESQPALIEAITLR